MRWCQFSVLSPRAATSSSQPDPKHKILISAALMMGTDLSWCHLAADCLEASPNRKANMMTEAEGN